MKTLEFKHFKLDNLTRKTFEYTLEDGEHFWIGKDINPKIDEDDSDMVVICLIKEGKNHKMNYTPLASSSAKKSKEYFEEERAIVEFANQLLYETVLKKYQD